MFKDDAENLLDLLWDWIESRMDFERLRDADDEDTDFQDRCDAEETLRTSRDFLLQHLIERIDR